MPDHQVPLLQLEKQNWSAATHGLPSFSSTGSLMEGKRGLPCMGSRGREENPFLLLLQGWFSPGLQLTLIPPAHPTQENSTGLVYLTSQTLGCLCIPKKLFPGP